MMMKQAAFVLRARDRTELEGILRDGNVPQNGALFGMQLDRDI
jgi:hypothetical protein